MTSGKICLVTEKVFKGSAQYTGGWGAVCPSGGPGLHLVPSEEEVQIVPVPDTYLVPFILTVILIVVLAMVPAIDLPVSYVLLVSWYCLLPNFVLAPYGFCGRMVK